MDLAGLAASGLALIRFHTILLFLACCAVQLGGQTSADSQAEKAAKLVAEERWLEVVQLAESDSARSADVDYYYGVALAKLERWDKARAAFYAGAFKSPHDERFPVELAGVAFKQKQYVQASRYLRRALKLKPDDAYANEFQATVYFLQGNLEAALKYWNRMGKPQVATLVPDPQPKVNAILLDHAFAIAPESTLHVSDWLTSEARLRGLGIFSNFSMELLARADGKSDVVFHNQERNGFGQNKWEALLRTFRGLPGETITPEYFNLHHQAINLVSIYRWDEEKRRLYGEIDAPLRGSAKRRFSAVADLRSENWDIRRTFRGDVPVLGSLNMRREALSAQVTSFVSGRWNWSTGVELSHRDFRDVFLGSALTPDLVEKGYQIKQMAEVNADVLRIPERRMVVSAGLSSQAGRIWSEPSHAFEKLQSTVSFHWFPKAEGDDYEVQYKIRGGRTWGVIPFDELYTFGGLGDNNLMMRGHITTHRGRKGSGPLGRNYFLSNWEMDKNVFQNGFVTVKLGPFLDTGKISDPSPGLSTPKWLWDTGGQVKVKALGLGFAVCYGKDLRAGNDAVFITLW